MPAGDQLRLEIDDPGNLPSREIDLADAMVAARGGDARMAVRRRLRCGRSSSHLLAIWTQRISTKTM